MRITKQLVVERETRNTIRYMEVDEKGRKVDMIDQEVGTIYVKKKHFQGSHPATITVIITDEQVD